MILHSHRLAVQHSSLASTGILKLSPGSINTVPGFLQFSLDLRSAKDATLVEMERQLVEDFGRITQGEDVRGLEEGGVRGRGCEVEWRLNAPSKAVAFDHRCIECVEDSARDTLGDKANSLMMQMLSGAGECMNYACIIFVSLMGCTSRS